MFKKIRREFATPFLFCDTSEDKEGAPDINWISEQKKREEEAWDSHVMLNDPDFIEIEFIRDDDAQGDGT